MSNLTPQSKLDCSYCTVHENKIKYQSAIVISDKRQNNDVVESANKKG
jgi:hypothetical protein